MDDPETFVFLLVEDYSLIAFANAIEPIRIANLVAERELYRWRIASENGRSARSSTGLETGVEQGLEPLRENDWLIVVAGTDVRTKATKSLLDYLRRERRRNVHLGAVCSGAYLIAKAGLLDGEACAIHWEHHDAFLEEFHDITLRRSVFVAEGPIVSAAGGPAAADLMLHLIGQRHGTKLAAAVADQMVYNAVRQGDAEQRISLAARSGLRSDRLKQAVEVMEAHVEDPLSTARIAEIVGVSMRQLERLFGRHANCSPKKYYIDLRLRKARNLLLQTNMSLTEIGTACGFHSPAHFTRSYRQSFGIPPTKERAIRPS